MTTLAPPEPDTDHRVIRPTRRGGLVERHSTWMTRVALIGMIITAVLVGVASVYAYQSFTQWDPLGEYPVQAMLTAEGTTPIGIPTYYLDDDITARAVKCNDSSDPVKISGSMSWVSEEPPGSVFRVGSATGERDPGCLQVTYSNPIPIEVIERAKSLADRGVTQSRWHMSGVETPVRDNGDTGEARAWLTTSFVLRHENRPK